MELKKLPYHLTVCKVADKKYRPGRRILLYRQNGRGTVTCLQDRGHSFKHYGS